MKDCATRLLTVQPDFSFSLLANVAFCTRRLTSYPLHFGNSCEEILKCLKASQVIALHTKVGFCLVYNIPLRDLTGF